MASYEDYAAYKAAYEREQKSYGGGGYTDANGNWQSNPQDNGSDTGRRVMAGILGGPIGWYEAATGKKVLTNEAMKLFGIKPTYAEMNDEDVFNSMSPGDWDEFNKMNDEERRDFVKSRKAKIGPELEAKREADRKRIEAEAKQKDFDDQRTKIIAKVQAFADEMGMPIEQLMQKDEFAKALNKNTYSQAMGAAANRGLGLGGLSMTNADQATKNALIGYQMQRQQAGQNALGNAYGMLSQMGGESENARRYEQGLNLQLQQASEAAQQRAHAEGLGQRQSLFGLAGGALGAYFGGPTGATMGYNLGSSIGGSTYNTYQPKGYTYPNVAGRGSGGAGGAVGGVGGVKYGGNY